MYIYIIGIYYYMDRIYYYMEESGWKHKNLPELVSDGRTEKTGLS